MNSNILAKFFLEVICGAFFLLLIFSPRIAQGQLSCGLQTGKYMSYLGDVTWPGFGVYMGIKAQTREKFALHYQFSFLRSVGKYDSFPMDNGVELNIEDEVNLIYLNDFSVNLTNLAIEANFTLFNMERISFDGDCGIGIGVSTFYGSKSRPYQTYSFDLSPDRSGLISLSIGIGSEYLWTDNVSIRAQFGYLLDSQNYNDFLRSKLGFSLGIVKHG